jgi:outer membrane protein TolC
MQTPQKGDAVTLSQPIAFSKPGPMKKTLLILLWWPLTGWAQDPMSLKDAVHLALNGNKSVEASDASRKAAESRIAEARGGSLPKVNYSES